jgi:hypothetical protein
LWIFARFVPQKSRLSESREPLVVNLWFDGSLRGKKSPNRRFGSLFGILCAKRDKLLDGGFGCPFAFFSGIAHSDADGAVTVCILTTPARSARKSVFRSECMRRFASPYKGFA